MSKDTVSACLFVLLLVSAVLLAWWVDVDYDGSQAERDNFHTLQKINPDLRKLTFEEWDRLGYLEQLSILRGER